MSNKKIMKELFDKQFNKGTNYNKILSKIEGVNNMKKVLTMAASIVLILVVSMSTYAALGGKLFGKPIVEWLGIKFSDEYQDYVIEENQSLSKNGTTINLVSKMCDDGFVVLEFDLILSDKDMEYLNNNDNSPQIETRIDGGDIKSDSDTGYSISIPEGIWVSFNNQIIEKNNEIHVDGANNFNITIDNENYWVRPRGPQTITQVSENQYKIYQMYFLTDKELGTKTDFTILLNNIVVCEYQTSKCIIIDGNFEIELSKNKAIENSKVIIPESNNKTQFKKMTKTVEKVTMTPLQTIVKVSSVIDDVSLLSLESTRNKNYIGLCDYKVYDQNGNQLTSCNYEVKRTVIYENGKIEEWEMGDIGTYKDFENAQMKLIEYIIIEKNPQIDTLTIKPIIRQPENGVEKEIELDNFNISLN